MDNVRDVAKQTLALVLAGGRGSRLQEQNRQFSSAVSSASLTLLCQIALTQVLPESVS